MYHDGDDHLAFSTRDAPIAWHIELLCIYTKQTQVRAELSGRFIGMQHPQDLLIFFDDKTQLTWRQIVVLDSKNLMHNLSHGPSPLLCIVAPNRRVVTRSEKHAKSFCIRGSCACFVAVSLLPLASFSHSPPPNVHSICNHHLTPLRRSARLASFNSSPLQLQMVSLSRNGGILPCRRLLIESLNSLTCR